MTTPPQAAGYQKTIASGNFVRPKGRGTNPVAIRSRGPSIRMLDAPYETSDTGKAEVRVRLYVRQSRAQKGALVL
jgi:hypothetical protein